MTLSTLLEHIRATLNTHPLYSFFTWNMEKIPGREKYNIWLESNRSHENLEAPYQIKMLFNGKAVKMLQKDSQFFNPMKGLRNVAIDRIIEVDYDPTFPVYIECSEIENCIVGKREKRIIKTVLLKNKSKKVEYEQHFPVREYHDSRKYNITSSIGIKLLDTSGYPIHFKSGEMAVTLHVQKKSTWEL